MKRCTKCILPETYAGIEFDEKGICNVCKNADQKPPKTEEDLIKILEEHKALAKKEGRKYDCIVPFSGGKDSAFTLYTVVKKYRMTPLVVTFNHCFFTDVVKRNRDKVLGKLGVDFIEFTPNWQIVKKLMLKSLKKTGDFCWHCHCGIYAYPMQIAVKYKIPLLIWGTLDYATDITILRGKDFFEKEVNLGIKPEEMVDENISLEDLQPFMYPPEEELKKLNIVGINQGAFIGWNVRKQVEFIKNELGWKDAEVEGTPYRHDKVECKAIGIRDYLKFIKRGYGRTCQLAAVDIRDGIMTRDTALKLIEKYDGKRPNSLTQFLKYVGISEEQFMEIAKKYKTY